ncbi:MAG: hypothetical protein IPK60_02120 [Sandaracinaceae bacterium]|jgi:hypothetical protein|nr:hypothetical protein [Sandaracinaceae bacterium]
MRTTIQQIAFSLIALSTAACAVEVGDGSVGRAASASNPGLGLLPALPPVLVSAEPTVPERVEILTPLGAVARNPVTFIWRSLPNATSYELVIERNDATYLARELSAQDALCDVAGATCSFVHTVGEGNGTVAIRAKNSVGDGAWSASSAFSVHLSRTAALLWPHGDAASSKLGYAWTPVSGASSYTLFVERDDADWQTFVVDASSACDDGLCVYNSATVHSEGSYAWWVQADEDGRWSLESSFTVGAAANIALITPNGSASSTSATFSWSPRSGEDHTYTVVVSDPNSTTDAFLNETFTDVQAGCAHGEGVCSIGTLHGMAFGATRWIVTAEDLVSSPVANFVVVDE